MYGVNLTSDGSFKKEAHFKILPSHINYAQTLKVSKASHKTKEPSERPITSKLIFGIRHTAVGRISEVE